MVKGGVRGVGRWWHAVAGKELLCGRGGKGRLHGRAERGGAGHAARIEVLLRDHHHLVPTDSG